MKSPRYDQDQGLNWDARLKSVSGTVSVKSAGSDTWSLLDAGVEMPLNSEDSLKTGSDGTAELYLDDKGVFYINRNSELEVTSIDQSDTSLALKLGSLAAKVKHFLSDRFKMQVRTPSAVCAIRGTEFAVEFSQLSKESGVAVYDEGRLAVTPVDDSGTPGQEYTLEKNTELVFNAAQKRIHPVPLSRMLRHRSQFSGLRARLLELKKNWKKISPAERAQLRDRALKRRVQRKELGSKVSPSRAAKVNKAGVRRARARKAVPEE
jgi:hypothetical protein